MNTQIAKLYEIAAKPERILLGLMSGTSLDGLDIALCKIENQGVQTKLHLLAFVTLPYEDCFRMQIREVFAKRTIDQQQLSALNVGIAQKHAQLILQALDSWQIKPEAIDAIASHGQTVYHAPQSLTGDKNLPNSTLQIGDGDHIAVKTGILTISDFRQKHLAAGGEGAPLAAYGDYLLFTDQVENRFLLNIGGIANFTFLPAQSSSQQAYATDIGPGNTLMNQYMHRYFNLEMDRDAALAKQGTPNIALLAQLQKEPFLAQAFPKTTGPELFNLTYLEEAQAAANCQQLPAEDVMATLCLFTAKEIAKGIRLQADGLSQVAIYISGGGLHNPLLMEQLQQEMPNIKIASFAMLGLDPDAKEACLFAVLANETLAGDPSNVAYLKDAPAVCMGKLSLPY